MDNAVLLMLSGGRDSFLSACKLLEDKKGYHVYMVTYDNGCIFQLDKVKSVADRIIQHYGADRAEYLGVYSIAGIVREFFFPYFNMKPEEQMREFSGMTPSQFHCLVCRTAMYIRSIQLCKLHGIQYIAEGGRKSQEFVIELPEMATKCYPELVRSQGLELLMPVYELDDDWVRDNELMMRGFVSKCDEAKCLIGFPGKDKIDQSIIDGVHAYYDKVILPMIEKRGLLDNTDSFPHIMKKKDGTESSSKKVVLVPGCLMCPVFHVKFDSTKLSWRDEILKALLDAGVGIIQMPCPEVSFGGYSAGMTRRPHGVQYYENLPGFQQHCEMLAENMVEQIIALKKNSVQVCAILGIENSPTCAVTRIFSFGRGTALRSGLFMDALTVLLAKEGITIPLVGITRHKKSQKIETKLLNELIG